MSNHTAQHGDRLLNNLEVAELLDEAGRLLQTQGANPFRAQAYKTAAGTVRTLPRPLGQIVRERGEDGLKELPGIGESLAKSLTRLVSTGRFSLLDRLRGAREPESVLATIGGIGPVLARRLRDELGINSLEDLDRMVSSGKLEKIPGFGEKRVRIIRESLAGRLRKDDEEHENTLEHETVPDAPPVEIILDIDREYREKVQRRMLPRITPKRYNPTKEAWLPVLHTERDGQTFTALFSNTARAHELGVTRDWVVVYRDERDGDGQWTVITSQYGALRGRRIIRGRESECRNYYRDERDRAA
jgi:putative hydrolase